MSPVADHILLASLSPRRRELLAQLGVPFATIPVTVDETPRPHERPEDHVRRVAGAKSAAGHCAAGGTLPVLAADTEVVIDAEVLGKPRDPAHAMVMLMRLSGREHRVLSAVSLRYAEQHWMAVSETRVEMRAFTPREVAAYWATGEPADKAGAYAIQGQGAALIRRIDGSYSGVMGLPLFETAELLQHVGLDVLNLFKGKRRADE